MRINELFRITTIIKGLGLRLLLVIVLSFTVRPASASYIIYKDNGDLSGRDDFLANAGSVKCEQFENLSLGSSQSNYDLGDFTISASILYVVEGSPEGDYPTEYVSGQWIKWDSGGDVVFEFDNPITSFSVCLTDAADKNNSITWDTDVFSPDVGDEIIATNQASATENFFGIISDTPFTQFIIHNDNSSDGMSIDNVTPEPASLSLLTLGGLALLRRRR